MSFESKQQRYLKKAIQDDALASSKMAFISGPRQVGKTTLAKSLLSNTKNHFLWEDEKFQKRWSKSAIDSLSEREMGPVIFDEIHKDRKWKNRLKGVYDKLGQELQIVVTGSARLDLFRKGGDSLMGRYLPYHLHPFSVAETDSPIVPDRVLEFAFSKSKYSWEDLLNLGGFPEPFFGASEQKALRWSRLRLEQLFREDMRDLIAVVDVNAMKLLADFLVERAGGLLSMNSLREDVSVAYGTIRNWIQVLQSLYYCFLVRPYAGRLNRALKAEPKFYLFDILRIPKSNFGARRENLAALHLLKACQYWTDLAYGEFDLRYVRNKEKREVDFLILKDQKPWILIECKSDDVSPHQGLGYFGDLLNVEHRFQLVSRENFDRSYPAYKTRILSYEKFFSNWV